ncbi:MAG: four helix bundle protein [bacterium]
MSIKEFNQLFVWQESHQLVLRIYTLSEIFPERERYSLTSQIRRAASSITSNIAEGFARKSIKEKIQFYYIASGSVSEVKSQLFLVKDLNYIDLDAHTKLFSQANKVHRLIYASIRKLRG